MTERLTESAKGVYIISATPFSEEGAIDYNSVDTLVEYYVESGVSGMTILGMMGEANKMSAHEAEDFMTYVLRRVDHRVPVIVGISDPGLANMTRLAGVSMDAGAAGVMIAPFYLTETGMAILDEKKRKKMLATAMAGGIDPSAAAA